MRIEKLNVNSFGMLTKKTFELKDGINLFEGENESGKSTISAFIKFMLYGLERRADKDKLSERARYINWKSGEASGSMTLIHGEKKYKIERSVRLTSISESGRENYRESLMLVDIESGVSVHEGKVPGEVFLGITKEVFENTAYIKQLGVSGVDASLVGEAIQNMLFSADEKINTQRALDKLDILRRSILHKNERGGALYELTLERNALCSELERAKDDNIMQIAKEGERADNIALIEASQKRLSQLKAKEEAAGILELLRRFESLHALSARVKSLEDEYEKFVSSNSHDGFFPDREYVKKLSSCERRIIGTRAELISRESEYSKLKYEGRHDEGIADVSAEIREAGGAEEIRAKFEIFASKKKTLGIFCAVFGLLSLICLLSSAVVFSMFSLLLPLGAVLASAGVIFVCAFLGCLGSGKKARRALSDFLARFGADGGESLERVIERSAEYEAEQRQLFSVLSVAEGEIKEKRAELDLLESERVELSRRWGGEGLDIHTLINKADETVQRAEEIMLEAEKYRAPESSVEVELRAYNEEELKKRFDALGVKDADKINKNELTREIDFLQKKIETLNYRKIETEKQLIALCATAKNPTVLSAEKEKLDERISELGARHAAYKLAIEAIASASERLRAGVAPRLSSAAKSYMSALTSGKYSDGGFSQGGGEFSIAFECDGEYRRLESLSEGTKDAAYISLRLSLADLLCKKGECVIILDESFAYLDDTRTLNLLRVLEESGKQSIVFSCRGRERELLREKDYNYIKL